jgi:lysozyme family protein
MADFLIADAITQKTEAGYSNNGSEAETAMGIDRGQNPNWSGWSIVDALKPDTDANITHKLFNDPDFMAKVHGFFKANYWDVLKLDEVNDQQIANNLFDCSINQGSGIAARFMQSAAGVIQDGIVGQQTLNGVNNGDAEAIYNQINAMRKARYENTHGFAQWGHSWLSRLIPYQT